MRHVSRTHRVALEWLFDRIILDTTTQVEHVDTKNQLADILTKGIFTRGEWNHFLRLFNIMDTSRFASCHFCWASSSQTMSKRLVQQERPGEDERVVAKSKPKWNLASETVDRSPIALGSSASHSLETLPVATGLNESTASSSQVGQSDAISSTSTERPVAKTTRIPLVQDCPVKT